MEKFKYEIVEELGCISVSQSGWKTELNMVAWNDNKPKYDIRAWDPEHKKMGKGISLDADEINKLYEILKGIVEN